VDIETTFLGIVAQFALFLVRQKAEGEIWHDQLSSRKQESRIQKAWENVRNEPWPTNRKRQAMLYRVAPTIKFLDSKKEPLVQIADFISGVIYGASRGGEGFLIESWDNFFPEGLRTTNLLHVQ